MADHFRGTLVGYGPHDPASAPQTTTVLPRRPSDLGDTREAPTPAALVAQRRQLNNLAADLVTPLLGAIIAGTIEDAAARRA